jgi:hypothetical protein
MLVPKEWCNDLINLFNFNQNSQISRQDSEKNIHPLLKSDRYLDGNIDISKYFVNF